MRIPSRRFWISASLLAAGGCLACAALGWIWLAARPAEMVIQCTPPPCQANERYICRSGNCPGGCGTGCATYVPAAISPTYPPPVCTPPACWTGESYFCSSGNCPGGCGTGCATHTPDPNAATTPLFPDSATVCALPAPAAEAPALRVCADALTAPISGTLRILAEAPGPPEPVFIVRGEDQGSFGLLNARIRAPGQTLGLTNISRVVHLDSVQVSGQRLLLTLTALAAGQIKLTLSAGGFSGGFIEAAPFIIAVTAP